MGDIEKIGQVFSPEGVRRKVRSLWAAWNALYSFNPPAVQSEYRAFKGWAANVLQSPVSQWFASGTLSELADWERRYDSAYQNATSSPRPTTGPRPLPPRPEVFDKPSFFETLGRDVMVALAAGAIVWFLTKGRK